MHALSQHCQDVCPGRACEGRQQEAVLQDQAQQAGSVGLGGAAAQALQALLGHCFGHVWAQGALEQEGHCQ